MTRYVFGKSHKTSWYEDMPEIYVPISALPFPTSFPSEARQTGILDADGNPIMSMPDPVGFLGRIKGRAIR